MYLLILESLGTQELILIGLIALVVFGPRRLPEMAKKMGSMINEFKKVSGDFRSTWENAINLESIDEPKKIETIERKDETAKIENTIGQKEIHSEVKADKEKLAEPEVRKVSKEEFDNLVTSKTEEIKNTEKEETPVEAQKTDWL